jgi:hypothetical protein
MSTCLLYKPIMVASIRNMHRVFAFRGITVFSGGLSRSIRLNANTLCIFLILATIIGLYKRHVDIRNPQTRRV